MYNFNSAEIKSVKVAVRKTAASLDNEIREVIDAAVSDMETSGVNTDTQPPAMVLQAVQCYARAYYNYNEQGAEWHERYKQHLVKMSLASAGDTDG